MAGAHATTIIPPPPSDSLITPKDPESNEELINEIGFANRGCCFWMPCFGSDRTTKIGWWERISTADKEETHWWSNAWRAVKKMREWSELVAGPRWKTFIRRLNKNRGGAGGYKQGAKFQYDPLSYSLNFDEGPGANDPVDDDRVYRDFSTRYAAIPMSAKSSMDLGHEGIVLT